MFNNIWLDWILPIAFVIFEAVFLIWVAYEYNVPDWKLRRKLRKEVKEWDKSFNPR